MNRICALPLVWCPAELVSELRDALRRAAAAIVRLVAGCFDPPSGKVGELYVATYAILLELLYADGEPSDDQRRHLERTLRPQLGLEPRAGCALLHEAERARKRRGLIASARLVAASYSAFQKAQLVRIMDELVRLDGVVTPRERYVLRTLVGLLRIDRDRPLVLGGGVESRAS